MSQAQYALAEAAWQAFRAPDPRALEDFLRTDSAALRFLAAALRRHLEELPWTESGLSRTERRLMELAQPGPIEIEAAFLRIHDGETAFFIADTSFWQVARELAAASPPLIAAEVESIAPDQLPRGRVSLTETGRAVLAGKADRVSRCGLDRWLGGVHLEGPGPVWRWDPARGRVDKA